MVKLTIDDINQRLKDRPLKCVVYGGSMRRKSIFICNSNHRWYATADSVTHGSGCPYCAGNAPLKLENVNIKLAKRKIVCLGYAGNVDRKSVFFCFKGHSWSTSLQSVLNGTGCPDCAGNARTTIEDVNEKLKERFIECLMFSGNISDKSLFKCNNGHLWYATCRNVIHNKNGCPTCSTYGFNIGKQGFLYVLLSENGNVKIGITNNIYKRIKTLRRNTPFNFKLIKVYKDKGIKVFNLEKYFHNKYQSAGLTGFEGYTEWLKYDKQLMNEVNSL